MKQQSCKHPILNIAAYKFVDLSRDWLQTLQPVLKSRCLEQNVKGAILLSVEGINLCLASEPGCIDEVRAFLNAQPPLADLECKISYSDVGPFKRLKVKVRQRLIPLEIGPDDSTPRIAPVELQRWLDEGRQVVLLELFLLSSLTGHSCLRFLTKRGGPKC